MDHKYECIIVYKNVCPHKQINPKLCASCTVPENYIKERRKKNAQESNTRQS
jgi:hypothetical protein